jgi:maltose/maltodextrin transport system permease protein
MRHHLGKGQGPGVKTLRTPGALGWAFAAVVALALLWSVYGLYLAGRPLVASAVLVLGALALHVYTTSTSLAWKYLFPGVAAMLVFIAFPLAYTVQLSFTNYSSAHLLERERAEAYLLEQREVDEATVRPFTLHRQGEALQLVLGAPGEPSAAAAAAAAAIAQAEARGVVPLVSPPLRGGGVAGAFETAGTGTPGSTSTAPGAPVRLQPGTAPASPALTLREVLQHRDALMALRLALPDGTELAYAGVREFARVQPVWERRSDGALVQRATGAVYRANLETGYLETEAGERMLPGFRVGIGAAHYARMLFDADFRSPFLAIFVWTVAFAGLTVLLATAIGLTLAVVLNWEALQHRTLYRTLLFLPYAVPGFISILVFKGLFNQNFGEINAILDALFGVRPAWFAEPWLARTMILIVNTWLGYPYIMVLCTGLIKAIPADLYEASAIEGAGPLANFRRITAPLILKPLTPLLIAAFAFNFNNFVLISLLTDGRPDFLDTKLPAGTTDILVSYTYRIAFTDSGQNFGLAAAISTLIFAMVALMALLQLRLMRSAQPATVRAPGG